MAVKHNICTLSLPTLTDTVSIKKEKVRKNVRFIYKTSSSLSFKYILNSYMEQIDNNYIFSAYFEQKV